MALRSPSSLWLYLLSVGVVREYGYLLAEPADRGIVSKGLGAFAILALLPLVRMLAPKSRMAFLVLAWWGFHAIQTMICSAAYYVEPWAVPVGQSICSARLGFDLGALGIMFAALLLYKGFHSKHPGRNDGHENQGGRT